MSAPVDTKALRAYSQEALEAARNLTHIKGHASCQVVTSEVARALDTFAAAAVERFVERLGSDDAIEAAGEAMITGQRSQRETHWSIDDDARAAVRAAIAKACGKP